MSAKELTIDERIKAAELRHLTLLVGDKLAPEEILKGEKIAPLLAQMNFTGTMNEVLVARLYAIAMNSQYPPHVFMAIRMINDLREGKKGKAPKTFVVNFVSPNSELQGESKTVELNNDSWSLIPGPANGNGHSANGHNNGNGHG